MNYDDETLMAYADGELDEARRAEIAAAIAQDPVLARRVEQHRGLRADLTGAYSGVLDHPVPDRLLAAARGRNVAPGGKQAGNVVQFPARVARAPATPWRAREWTAMAASLVVGVLLSWRFLAPAGDLGTRDGSLVARGALAGALDSQLASTQPEGSAVVVGVTFKSRDGDFCRSFVVRASSTAGLACHSSGSWRIPATQAVELQGSDLRQAAAAMPPAILAAIESRMTGDALDAEAELAARDAGWR